MKYLRVLAALLLGILISLVVAFSPVIFGDSSGGSEEFDVYSYDISSGGNLSSDVFYTVRPSDSCPTGQVREDQTNAGTVNVGSEVVLLKTKPGEELQFCNDEENLRSQRFTVSESGDISPSRVGVGRGFIRLDYAGEIG